MTTRTLAVPTADPGPLMQPHGAAVPGPGPGPAHRARILLAQIEALPLVERARHREHERQLRELIARMPEVRG